MGVINRRLLEQNREAKRGLRFDKVALSFVERLQDALEDDVPRGKTLIVISSAPIRLPAKTAKAVEEKVRPLMQRQSKRLDFRDTIHGNAIRARLATGAMKGQSNVIGFVQNPDADSEALLKTTQSLLEQVTA